MQDPIPSGSPLFDAHPRSFAANCYVYPVLSRRAGGISIGVNLNLDRACNFRCIYCQVDRSGPAEADFVDLDRLAGELDRMVELVASGRIYEGPQFRGTPRPLRRLNDIALSGDGEPTAYANFDRVVDVCAEVRRRHGLHDVKLVLITNASLLHLPRVRRALATLDANGGEIWAKLDAGTRRLLPAGGPIGRALAADSRQSARGGPRAADRDPIALDADLGPRRRRRPSWRRIAIGCWRFWRPAGESSWSKSTRSPENRPKSGLPRSATPRSTPLPN